MLGTLLICTYICTVSFLVYCQYETEWVLITTDCPDDSCGQVSTVTGFVSHLALTFTPELITDPYTRRYIWLYSWPEGLQPVQQGRIMFSEYEGYSIQLQTSCGPVYFASTNLTNTGGTRTLLVRATDTGVRITFPDNTTWATCISWNVTIVAFDKFMKIGAEYTTSPTAHGDEYNLYETGDMCVVAGDTCTNTSYCTASGFCEGWKEKECKLRSKASICNSCMSGDTISCNSTYQCLSPDSICNGVRDCDNGEDEADCGELPECLGGTECEDGNPSSSTKLTKPKTELCMMILAVLSFVNKLISL